MNRKRKKKGEIYGILDVVLALRITIPIMRHPFPPWCVAKLRC